MTASSAFADDSDGSIVKIKSVDPPASVLHFQQEMPREPSYFATGTVDAVGDDWITINDHQLFIAPGASIRCSVGSYVGIRVNNEEKVIFCEKVRRPK